MLEPIGTGNERVWGYINGLRAATELPALTGSEKQVTWATELRASQIDDMDKAITEWRKDYLDESYATPEQRAEFERRTAEARAAAIAETSAAWWINHRMQDPRTLVPHLRLRDLNV